MKLIPIPTIMDYMSEEDLIKERKIDNYDFILRVFKVFEDFSDDLCWKVDENDNIKFYVICSDLFLWGCADAECINFDNVDILEKTYSEFESYGYNVWSSLFCCRSRKMRPQKPVYNELIPKELHEIFDSCGPERSREDESLL